MHNRFLTAVLCAAFGVAGQAAAQQVQPLNVSGPGPQLIDESGSEPVDAAPAAAPVDLGQKNAAAPAATSAPGPRSGHVVAGMSLPAPLAGVRTARAAAQRATLRPVAPLPAAGPVERAVFAREPVRVQLQVGRERLITLPSDALLHVPDDMEAVARLESIGGTIYATALVPFTAIRIVAELVDSGQQIPIDLLAANTTKPDGELQVAVMEPPTVPNPMAGGTGAASQGSTPAADPVADMVQLTRHAARQLYAPRRLANGSPGVSQVAVDLEPVPGLLRGVNVVAQPLGQWKSGNLYVTAVRITNQSRFALELPLESVRGRWISATAQHGRIGAAGTDTDTTALYLVCDRSFAACL